MQRFLPALHFGTRQVHHVGRVKAVHMRQIQIGGLARRREGRPRTANIGAVCRYHAQFAGGIKFFIQIGAAQRVFFARGFLRPGAAPVGIGGGLAFGVVQKCLGIHARCVKHRGHTQHLVLGRFAVAGPGQVGDICVARAINNAFSQHHLAARFALGHDAAQALAVFFKNHIHRHAVQDGPYPSFSNQVVGHDLEKIGVQALAIVVRPLDGATHLRGNALHFDANALAFHRAFVAVPGQGFHAHSGNHATQAAIAL